MNACRCLDEVSGLRGERIPGLTGVWVDGQKVAAIGVRAQRWVTYHGLAINIANDLRPFKLITPCGIKERAVTSVKVRHVMECAMPWAIAHSRRSTGILALLQEAVRPFQTGVRIMREPCCDRAGAPPPVKAAGCNTRGCVVELLLTCLQLLTSKTLMCNRRLFDICHAIAGAAEA